MNIILYLSCAVFVYIFSVYASEQTYFLNKDYISKINNAANSWKVTLLRNIILFSIVKILKLFLTVDHHILIKFLIFLVQCVQCTSTNRYCVPLVL